MPGLVKIGMTTSSPYDRAEQLSTTGVPEKFVVEEYWECASEELKSIEREIHKKLDNKRYRNNREFFWLSVDDARHFISDYFKRKSDLEIKHLKEEQQRKEREEKAKKAIAAKQKIENLIIGSVDSLILEINSNKNKIEDCLELKFPAANIIKFASEIKRKEIPGKVISHTGWKVSASYSYHGGGKRAKQLQEDNAKVYIFIGAKVKRMLQSAGTYRGYFSASYFLHSGEINLSKTDGLLNELVKKGVFPKTLHDLFRLSGLSRINEHWSKVFGENAEIRNQIKEGVECPSCNTGKLVLRKRNKDGKPFYGCSEWPKCNFTFNVLPEASIEEKATTAIDNATITPKYRNIEDGVNIIAADATLSNSGSRSLHRTKASTGISIWHIIGIMIIIKLVIGLAKLQ